MRQKAVWQKLKSFGSFCLILLLLPYIVTVFVHGKDFKSNRENGTVYVNVRRTKGTVGFTQIESTLDMFGIGRVVDSEKYQEANSNAADEPLVVEVPWKEYFAGVMAREVPVDASLEFLKAQAVLVRTKLYQDLDNPEEEPLDTPYLTRQELEEKLSALILIPIMKICSRQYRTQKIKCSFIRTLTPGRHFISLAMV